MNVKFSNSIRIISSAPVKTKPHVSTIRVFILFRSEKLIVYRGMFLESKTLQFPVDDLNAQIDGFPLESEQQRPRIKPAVRDQSIMNKADMTTMNMYRGKTQTIFNDDFTILHFPNRGNQILSLLCL